MKNVQIRDLKARGIQAVTGVLRLYAPGGRFQEKVFRHEHTGEGGLNRIVLPQSQFDLSPAGAVDRIEGFVTGGFFADDSVCGENGTIAKSHYEDAMEDQRKDLQEALQMAGKLTPAQFGAKVQAGLIPVGPYSRSTSASFNQAMNGLLLGADGKLVENYKVILTRLADKFKPAKQSRPTQSSQPRVPGTGVRQKASSATSKGI